MTQTQQQEAIELMELIDRTLTQNNIWYTLSYGSALGAVREKGFIKWDGDIDILIRITDQDKVREVLKQVLPSKYILLGCDEQTIAGFDEIDVEGISSDDLHIDIYPLVAGPDDAEKGYRFMRWCRFVHRVFTCKYVDYDRLQSKWKIPFVALIALIERLIPDNVFRRYYRTMFTKYDLEKAKYAFPLGNDGRKNEYMEKDLMLQTKRTAFEHLSLPVPQNSTKYLTLVYGEDYMTPKKY